jgi:transposase
MTHFVEGTDRGQSTLFPECLDDWVDENNSVRVIDAFVDTLDLSELGFEGVEPAETGRPAYHPSALLKLYVYGYLNQVQSSRRLEREAGRNVELMWLLGRLVPDQRRSPISGRTTAVPSARCARALSNSAGRWVCL